MTFFHFLSDTFALISILGIALSFLFVVSLILSFFIFYTLYFLYLVSQALWLYLLEKFRKFFLEFN